MFNRKSQAAMEFLMTYGWVILVVLAAIGALAYFGVSDSRQYSSSRCFFPMEMSCLDTPERLGSIIGFTVKNNMPTDITVKNISVFETMCNSTLNEQALPVNISQDQVMRVAIDCPGIGDYYNLNVNVEFLNKKADFTRAISGNVKGR